MGSSQAGQGTCFARPVYLGSNPPPRGAALRTITPRSSGVTASSVTDLLRSDDTAARYSQGAQGIDMEHSETGSCQ